MSDTPTTRTVKYDNLTKEERKEIVTAREKDAERSHFLTTLDLETETAAVAAIEGIDDAERARRTQHLRDNEAQARARLTALRARPETTT